MDDARARCALQMIAHTLGISIDEFYDQPSYSRDSSSAPAHMQAAELLTLFLAIADPEVRQLCLVYVREAAGGTDRVGGQTVGLR